MDTIITLVEIWIAINAVIFLLMWRYGSRTDSKVVGDYDTKSDI